MPLKKKLPEVFENIMKGNKIVETRVCTHWKKYTYNIPHIFLISAVTSHSAINSGKKRSSQRTLYSPECQGLSITWRVIPNKLSLYLQSSWNICNFSLTFILFSLPKQLHLFRKSRSISCIPYENRFFFLLYSHTTRPLQKLAWLSILSLTN